MNSIRLSAILPSEENFAAMGRRRHQQPSVFKTIGKRPEWFVRARVDALTSRDGAKAIERPERRLYLGYCDEMTKAEAKQKRDEMLSEVVNRPQLVITSQVKFAEVLKVYRRDHLAALRETTQATQGQMLAKDFEPTLGKLRMCDLDAQAIQRWLLGLDMAYSSRQNHLNVLRCIWHKAQDWGYAQRDFPRGKFTLGVRRPVKGRDMPTMEQLRRLLLAMEDPFRAMAEVALYSGLRISEIRGLKWEDIGAETVAIRRRLSRQGGIDVPKTQRSARTLDVRPLRPVLARLKRDSEWIFGGHTSYQNCMRVLTNARAVAGITVARFGWHHLRAIFNTLARSSGADNLDRQALMGHSTEAMNAVYVLSGADDLRRQGDLMMSVQGLIMGETKGVQ